MKQKLIKVLLWCLGRLENDIEKAVREMGVPKVIYCHPSVFADIERKAAGIWHSNQGIQVIESEMMDKGKFIFSWNEPSLYHPMINSYMSLPISNQPTFNITGLGMI